MRQTTVGWKFLVEWANGSQQWIELKTLKESNPIQVTEYAMAHGIGEDPAFVWWVLYVSHKRDVIVSAVNSRVRKTSHKYGIELPSAVKNVIEINCKNGNTLWQDALAKEMGNVCVALKSLVLTQKRPRVGIKLWATLSLTLRWISLGKHNGLRMVTRPLTPPH
jgi:hypothetical protein